MPRAAICRRILPSNPTYRKVESRRLLHFPDRADLDRSTIAASLYDAASTIMQQKLSQIQGVGQVFVGGSSLPAVRVEVNPTQLNSYGLGLQDVRNMLSQQNANLPKGQIWNDDNTRRHPRQRPTAESRTITSR